LVGKVEGKRQLQDIRIDRRMILERILKKSWKSVYWDDLAQDRDMWGAVVKTVMDLLFCKTR
jgi:hypothetical protein